jgi:hypothetical protein
MRIVRRHDDDTASLTFWQVGGATFLAGVVCGVLFGGRFLHGGLFLTVVVFAAAVFTFGVRLKAAGWTSEEMIERVLASAPKYVSTVSTVVAAFAGYGLGAMISGS